MKITYSEAADALYATLGTARGRCKTREFAPGIYGDFDGRGKLVGIEVFDASTHYSKGELAALHPPVEWLTLAEAEKEVQDGEEPIRAVTLRALVASGELLGRKIGKTWQVARHSLGTYLVNRPKRGPKVGSKLPGRRKRRATMGAK